jgi:O-antigen/teichoic acid export membrane protein
VIGGLVSFVISLHYLRKLDVLFRLYFDKDLIKKLIIGALPLGLMFIFSQMSFKEDALMISFLRLPSSYGLNNTESVAVYALPYKIFEVCLVLPTFFMNSTYPVLVKKMEEGEEALKKVFKKSFVVLACMGLAVALMSQPFIPFAVNFLGDSQFTESILVLRLLLIGIVFYYLTSPLSWLVVTLGYQKRLPIIYFSSAVFNLFANLIFIPKYSFYAATVITQLSELIIFILLLNTAKKSWKDHYATS